MNLRQNPTRTERLPGVAARTVVSILRFAGGASFPRDRWGDERRVEHPAGPRKAPDDSPVRADSVPVGCRFAITEKTNRLTAQLEMSQDRAGSPMPWRRELRLPTRGFSLAERHRKKPVFTQSQPNSADQPRDHTRP